MSPSASSRSLDDEDDHFDVLGLVREFELDREQLEQRYLDLSRRHHPDRFVGAAPREQRRAMELSARLNEAYRTLRDPVRRAEYLVLLGGIDVDSSDHEGGAPAMEQTFLIDMLERREQLVELGRDAAALDEMRTGVEDEANEALDGAVRALSTGQMRAAAVLLVQRRYFQRLIDEIDRAQGVE